MDRLLKVIRKFLLIINWTTLGSIVVIIGIFLGISLLVAIFLHFLINRIFGYSGNKDLDYKDKVTAKAKELFNRYKHQKREIMNYNNTKIKSELSSNGVLRAAINMSNILLVTDNMSFHPKVRDPQNPYRTGVLISNHVEDRFGQDLAENTRQGATGMSENQAKYRLDGTMTAINAEKNVPTQQDILVRITLSFFMFSNLIL